MTIFSEDTNAARSILAKIASHSISLLDTGKFGRMACSILTPIGALSCKPTLGPIFEKRRLHYGSTSQRYPGSHPVEEFLLKSLPLSAPLMPSEVYIEYWIHLAQQLIGPSTPIGEVYV